MAELADKKPKIITISSGKGGVGKTCIALNLALGLIKAGHRVCLLDADLGLANVDVLLGLSPEHSLMEYIEGQCALDNLIIKGPGGLCIIPGGSGLDRLPDLRDEEKDKLANIIPLLQDYDELIIDTAAGISDIVLHFLEAATIPVIAIIPEPTSLTDAYSLLKTYCGRGYHGPVYILLNQVKTAGQAKRLFNKFNAVVGKYLDISIKPLGFVVSDDKVQEAVKEQTPFVSAFPDAHASICMQRIAHTVSENHHIFNSQNSLDQLFFANGTEIREGMDEDDLPARDNEAVTQDSETFQPQKAFTGEIIKILINEGRLNAEQVDYARKVQQKLDTPKRLLDILKELGYIQERQIKETLFKNRTGIRLGSLLVELGYISEKQLTMALNQQKREGSRKLLGKILVENNYISEYELIQALSINLGISYVEPSADMVDTTLWAKASNQFYHTHRLLPLKMENGSLLIAMADPLNAAALEAAQRLFGTNIIISITMDKFINETLQTLEAIKSNTKHFEINKNEIVALVDSIIKEAIKKKVSDIHLEPLPKRLRVRFRRDGSLFHHMDISKDLETAVISRIKIMASANIAEKRRHQDGRILLSAAQFGEEIDIRVSLYVTLFGEKAVLRILTKKAELYKISDLGMGLKMLDRFRYDVLDLPSGVVIITGPTGAGKTTSLYASINYCNNVDTNIITAEEPVEYVIDGISQCSIDPKIGRTFEETLRHILRQDPDIIILGEIRDKFSAESAIQAALTGHKVLTTFHTEDSIGGLLRLMNMDIETFLISSTVVCVVAQRLLKKVCPFCQEPYAPSARDLRRLKYQPRHIHGYQFRLGTGCPHCDFTGYRGRVGVFEMLVLNEAVKEALLNRKTSYEIRRISMETTGLVTLLEDGIAKAAKGITSIPELIKQLPLLEIPRPIEQIYRLNGEI